MSNSKLISCSIPSPFNSGQRTHSIDRITPHCVVGQASAKSVGLWFQNASARCSSNYGIGKDGEIGLYVDESKRSWCSSSSANDNRAITIECASDTTEPYTMHDCVFESLVKLCADICQRNGKNRLIWIPDKDKALNYAPKSNEMLITVHRWFSAMRTCPGTWLYSRLDKLADRVNVILGTAATATTPTTAPKKEESKPSTGYLVRVSIPDLYIRNGPGTMYANKGFIAPGAYTIVEERKTGSVRWGRLKSGAGWICLAYTERI